MQLSFVPLRRCLCEMSARFLGALPQRQNCRSRARTFQEPIPANADPLKPPIKQALDVRGSIGTLTKRGQLLPLLAQIVLVVLWRRRVRLPLIREEVLTTPFQLEQISFCIETTRKARELAGMADDAMA